MGQKTKKSGLITEQIKGNSKGRSRKVIILLFIIGMAFIAISVLLSLTHYFLSERLAEKNEAFRIYGLDCLLYQVNEQSALNTSFMILLGTEIVPPYKGLDYFKQHFHVQNIETLSSLHRVLFGEDVDPALLAKWKKIKEHNKYQDEKKKMFDRAILYRDDKEAGGHLKFGLKLFSQMKRLKEWLHFSMTASIILQVIGLALNQLAVILQMVWKEA